MVVSASAGIIGVERRGTKGGTYDVRRGGDGGEATGADVDGKSNEGADERAELENSPENGEGLALVLFERVGHHDGTLRRPEEGSRDTEKRTRENNEPSGALRLVAGERGTERDISSGSTM